MMSAVSSSAPITHVTHTDAFRLGMPHLGMAGLSEEWLLRQLGANHWAMLEEATGQPSTRWSDAVGRRLYASFVAVEVRGELLSRAVEGEAVQLHSGLERIGSSVHASRHSLSGDCWQAEADLISILVRRGHPRSNHDFERVDTGPTVARGPSPTRRSLPLLEEHRRGRDLMTHSAGEGQDYPIRPWEEFNNAGMVYFANYPRFVNRLILDANASAWPGLKRRRVFYYGNLNIGDVVRAEALPKNGHGHHTRLRRLPGGAMVALCETEWQ